VRRLYVELGVDGDADGVEAAWRERADARIRTADPFITSEVLYQLSYVGGEASIASGFFASCGSTPACRRPFYCPQASSLQSSIGMSTLLASSRSTLHMSFKTA
jgi:hypothetical protein